MKNFKLPSWALILTITLSNTAFADICQKDSLNRIKMYQQKDHTWAASYFTDQVGPPVLIGPTFNFTEAELAKKRALENEAVDRVKVRDTGALLGLFALMAIVSQSGPGDIPAIKGAAAPQGASPTDKMEASIAKEELTVLDKSLFTTSSECIYVPSLDKHVEILGRVLGEIYGQRFTSASVTGSKTELDLRAAKGVPAAVNPSTKVSSDSTTGTTPAN